MREITGCSEGLILYNLWPTRIKCESAAGALAGILPLLHAALVQKKTIAGKHPWLLFSLACAIRPRMLYTIDEDCKLLPVSVRVGQAIDTVAQVRPGSGMR